jgi:hypothetical protein
MAEGMRRIVVDGQTFRWRFDEVLVVIPGDRSGPQLYVDWGWRDHLEPDGPGAEPQVVTPKFVAEAIRFAVAHGWSSIKSAASLSLGFQSGSFTLFPKSSIPDGRNDMLRHFPTLLGRWQGAWATMSELTNSHRTLRIVLSQDSRAGRLIVACLDPLFIHGPVQWPDARIEVALHKDNGFVITDTAADVRIITGSVEVKEYV